MSDPTDPASAVTYSSYLEVPGLLSLQHPRSEEDGRIAEHDELLFITIHQVYELWFKQVLHELRGDEAAPGTGGVQGALSDGDAYGAMALLGRVLKILKTLVVAGRRPRDDDPAAVQLVPRPAGVGVRIPVGAVPRARGRARPRATRAS